jgi:hypothetical protein
LPTMLDSFQAHRKYKRLFGDQVLKVVPSLIPKMSFQAVNPHLGHEIHFGRAGEELIICPGKDIKAKSTRAS